MNITSLNFNRANIQQNIRPKEEPKVSLLSTYAEKPLNLLGASQPSVIQAIKAQTTIAPSPYKEIETFNVPYLNAKGKMYMLNNGQKVIVIPKEGPCSVKTYVKVGSFNEPDNIRGISHFIEHNLFNGDRENAFGEFVKKVSEMGSTYNASTNFCLTDYYIKSPLHGDKDFSTIMSMHANMLQHPLFTQAALDKEKGPVISEVQMYQDSPNNTAQNIMLKKLFNIKTESPDLIAGSVKSVSSITRKDVLDYYTKWYTPDNMTTVIIGDIDPEIAIKTASKSFGGKQLSPSKTMNEYINKFTKKYEVLDTSISYPRRTDTFSSLINSTTVGLGFIGPKNNDLKESVKAEALTMALTGYDNSKLSLLLKTYNTQAISALSTISPSFNDPQVLQIDTIFKPKNEKEGLKAIYNTIETLKAEPLSDFDLQIIKNKLKDALNITGEFSSLISDQIGDAIVNKGNLKAYTEKAQMIDKLTAQDIQDSAQKYLDLNKVSLVVLHPETERARIESEAKSLKPNDVAVKSAEKTKSVAFSGSKNVINSNEISEYTLNNNANLTVNDAKSSTRTSINFLMQTGDIYSYKPSVPDILTEIFNNGSSHYSKESMSGFLDTNNIKTIGRAGSNAIVFGLECPNENQSMGIDAMKEILLSPNLNQGVFQEIKAGLKLRFLSQQKDPKSKAMEAMYGDHPYGNSDKKKLESLDSVTLQDVKDFYNKIISNSETSIIATAPFSKTPGLKEKLFNSLQNGLPVSKPYKFSNKNKIPDLSASKVLTEVDNRQQAHVVQLFKINESGNVKDRAALHLMNTLLGESSQSKLFMNLREKQLLAYMVKSKYATDGKNGEISLEIKTTTDDPKANNGKPQYDNIQKSLDGFKKYILEMQTNLVSDEELNAAKLSLKSKVIFGCESSAGKTDLIQGGFNTPYGTQYLPELLKAVDNITVNDIKNAAKLYLSTPSVISIVASKDTIASQQNYLKTLGEVTNY